MATTDSDLSSNEEEIKSHQHKKDKHLMADKVKKRKKSNSADHEKVKKRKPTGDFEIKSDNSLVHKSKSNYTNKEKNQKGDYENKKNPIPIDSDPEKDISKNDPKKKKYPEDKNNQSRRDESRKKSISEDTCKKSSVTLDKSNTVDVNKLHHDNKIRHGEDDTDEERKCSAGPIITSVYSNNKKKKYSGSFKDWDKIGDHNRSGKYKRGVDNNDSEIKGAKRSAKDRRKATPDKNRSKFPYDKIYVRKVRENSLTNSDEDYRDGSGKEKPYRYWSSSRGPVRKNSDSYWNKYSERLKEGTDVVEVGPRYYSSGENLRKEKDSNDGSKDKQNDDIDSKKEVPKNVVTPKQKKTLDLLTSRTGGAYIPPAKLRMMQESITDKASAAYQRVAWEALKKSIQGHVNKVNTANIKIILKAIIKENLIRGRGLLCRALVQAQAASPSFTNVYAAFASALNTKYPRIGELLLKRLVVQFRRGFKRNDKTICITAATFIAHLVNQGMAHEIIALEILTLLIETPTDDSVEVAIAFLKESGMKLTEVASKGIMAIFDMLRNILHEGKLEKRVQYMIEVMFQVRKEDFKAHPSISEDLDIVDEEEKIQHMITLEDNHDPEDILNVFKFDPDYEANEAKYKSLVDVGSDAESEGDDSAGSGDSDDDSDEQDAGEGQQNSGVIVDKTETNLVALRKTIYLTIQSSLDFEECAHKLLRMELKPGQEIEMAHMFLDCCAEQRTYEKFFGLLAQRFCQINRSYVGPFEETFRDSYSTIHRMSNDKLRNVGKLFAHLLYTDAISWDVLASIRLNEDDTTSSSRIFIKILFLELSEYMGLAKLNQRVKDPSLQMALEGLFPRDNPKHTRFAINFFTSIGLGGLTDELREHLKSQPKQSIVVPQLVEGLSSSSSSSDCSSDSSDSSLSSTDSSSTESSSSESDDTTSRKKRKGKLVNAKKNQVAKKQDKSKSSKMRKPISRKNKRDR